MTGQKRHTVRYGFSELDVWRDALGGQVLLHVFSIDGDLSAPDYTPAGSMRATNYGPQHTVATRS